MTWPETGQPLPRLPRAYVPSHKWGYILRDEGPGPHWLRVFGDVDAERLWNAITVAVIAEPITFIRDLGPLGQTCRVPIQLTLNDRTATVVTVWQYDYEDAPPRLVTAYPTT
jgi:hypothetical protein